MGSGFRVATIRDIDIKIHASFGLALLWVIYYWGIATGDGVRGALFGFFLLVSVFVCVIGHELAHSFLALRYGLNVHDITLLPIGGVARIEQTSLTPRREAMIALAGPILNIVVAIGLMPVVIAVVLSNGARDPMSFLLLAQETGPGGLLLHLWIANLMLAFFNLLPAFPMDGGRVLRALLTVLSNRVMATRIAVFFGHLLAFGLVVVGIYTRDVALPLVAVFILIAAILETRMIQIEAAFRTLPVGQFAVWDRGGISPDATLSYALRGGPRDVVVTAGGRVVGMLWREDILGLANSGGSLRVADVMDTDVTPMNIDVSVFDVHRRMLTTARPAIPIVEAGMYRGIFTSDRLVHVHQYLQGALRGFGPARSLVALFGLYGR